MSIAELYPPNIYYHAESLVALERSGHSCQLCKLMHWSISRANEPDDSPELDIAGAPSELVSYEEDEERGRCSVKLQIKTRALEGGVGREFEYIDTNEIREVGIWMRSKHMITTIGLVVEEGTRAYMFEPVFN